MSHLISSTMFSPGVKIYHLFEDVSLKHHLLALTEPVHCHVASTRAAIMALHSTGRNSWWVVDVIAV